MSSRNVSLCRLSARFSLNLSLLVTIAIFRTEWSLDVAGTTRQSSSKATAKASMSHVSHTGRSSCASAAEPLEVYHSLPWLSPLRLGLYADKRKTITSAFPQFTGSQSLVYRWSEVFLWTGAQLRTLSPRTSAFLQRNHIRFLILL